MKRFLAASAACLLAACGRNDQVAGGGSDQPNKIQAGRILTDSGAPAAGVFVESWAGSWNPQFSRQSGRLLDSGTTDDSGAWHLALPDTGDWFVLGRNANSMAVITKGQKEGRLAASSTLRGSVSLAAGLQLDALWLGGGAGAVAVGADRSFSATTQPGPKRLWAKVRWNGGFDTILVRDLWLLPGDNAFQGIAIDTASSLLASGESSPARSSLRGVDFPAMDTQDGSWFAATDNSFFGTSTVSPSTFPWGDSAVVTEPASGRFLSWTFQLGSPIQLQGGNNIDPWVGVGFRLSRRDLDWSGVRRIVMKVRGSGSVRVLLDASRSSNSTLGQYNYDLSLSGRWTEVAIPLDSMHPLSSAGTGTKWSEARANVRNLSFYALSGSVHLDLKEVRAEGSRSRNW